jgi:GxxExxY protein
MSLKHLVLNIEKNIEGVITKYILLQNGNIVSTSKNLKTIKGYINRNYLKELDNTIDPIYLSKLIMLQLEYNKSLESIDKLLIEKPNILENTIETIKNNENNENENIDIEKERIHLRKQQEYEDIIEASRVVYNELNWGWAESVYREALSLELQANGYECSQEVSIPIKYKNRQLSHVNSRIDILAKRERDGKQIIIELKADAATKISMEKAEGQCQRYMNLLGIDNGIVINFPDKICKEIETIIL